MDTQQLDEAKKAFPELATVIDIFEKRIEALELKLLNEQATRPEALEDDFAWQPVEVYRSSCQVGCTCDRCKKIRADIRKKREWSYYDEYQGITTDQKSTKREDL